MAIPYAEEQTVVSLILQIRKRKIMLYGNIFVVKFSMKIEI